MYISIDQLEGSLRELDRVHPFFGISFLAFKQLGLRIGTTLHIDIANQEKIILEQYYDPLPNSQYYYIPLRGTGPKERWVSKRKYTTSGLQKIRTTTFLPAFLHPSKQEWGWNHEYLSQLTTLARHGRVPVFHLAVWMFRNKDWVDTTTPEEIINYFLSSFDISQDEQDMLFDTSYTASFFPTQIFQKEPVTWKNLKELIGSPPDATPDEGGGLEFLELVGVGPAKRMELDLAQRLNLITGDNGLGKTFLLECAWWALSGYWADPEQPAYPRSNSFRPTIRFQISGSSSSPKTVYFDKSTQTWPLPDKDRSVLPGIVIYARVDGSCTIWDPAKHYWPIENDRARGIETSDAIRLTQQQIWYGLESPLKNGRVRTISNGLIRDWITWQDRPSSGVFETFSRVLQKLSPYPGEINLVPGTPTKLPGDEREIPQLKLPYDEVPITLLSAGIKRILSLAYLLVWTWETHKDASKIIGKPPQSKIVFVIDEMEAHLHPRWQRIIVPAILDVVTELEAVLEVQLIIATHSPLIMASVEPIFDEQIDSLFTLDLIGQELEVKELAYTKYGSINSWLTSEVFDLKRAYSVEAEEALIKAKELQLASKPDPEAIEEVDILLAEHLPAIDPFWPRWRAFAERFGGNG